MSQLWPGTKLPSAADLVDLQVNVDSLAPDEARFFAQELGVLIPEDSDSAVRARIRAAIFE